jgi:L-fuculose-phosphate aldolase
MPDHLGMDASEYLAAAESIIRAGARLGARGLIVGAEGNLSIRLGDQLLVTPSGRRKDELSVDDLLLVPLDPDPSTSAEPAAHGHRTDGMNGTPAPRPSSDIAVHRAVYRARPDVRAVAHAHLAASLALTLAGERPNPDDLPETRLLLPRLPFVPLLPMGSLEIAAAVASALTEPPEPLATAVLQERHGAVTVGETLEAAVDRLELVDLLCRVRRDVLLIEASRRPR